MAYGASSMRGLSRYFSKKGIALPKLVIWPVDTTPVEAPLHIRPTEVPSGTLSDGDFWYDDDNDTLAWFNGTANIEALTSGGLQTVAGKRVVKTGAATLTAAESGALCIFNAAAGFTYTLPAAEAGLWFEFIVQTTATSVVHRIACASGDFLLGTILQSTDGTYTVAAQTANGTTHLAWEGNGSTTGGIIGDRVVVAAISGTQWSVYGTNSATGTEATPFKTS